MAGRDKGPGLRLNSESLRVGKGGEGERRVYPRPSDLHLLAKSLEPLIKASLEFLSRVPRRLSPNLSPKLIPALFVREKFPASHTNKALSLYISIDSEAEDNRVLLHLIIRFIVETSCQLVFDRFISILQGKEPVRRCQQLGRIWILPQPFLSQGINELAGRLVS